MMRMAWCIELTITICAHVLYVLKHPLKPNLPDPR